MMRRAYRYYQCIELRCLNRSLLSKMIKVSVRVVSLSLRLRLITLISILIILDITKTLSNNN